jgi:hypothetical protein
LISYETILANFIRQLMEEESPEDMMEIKPPSRTNRVSSVEKRKQDLSNKKEV